MEKIQETLQNTFLRKKPKKELGGRRDIKAGTAKRGCCKARKNYKRSVRKLMEATSLYGWQFQPCSGLEIMTFGSCTTDSTGHKSVDEVWH